MFIVPVGIGAISVALYLPGLAFRALGDARTALAECALRTDVVAPAAVPTVGTDIGTRTIAVCLPVFTVPTADAHAVFTCLPVCAAVETPAAV